MVSYFGEYKCENLQEIIEDNEVSIVVFPFLVPETFSYVISELMLMDIPIICFNLGAQAEKISNYSKGIIAKDRINLIDILRNIKENNSFNKWSIFKLVDTI